MADAASAAGKVALGHGNPITQAVNRRQLETIKPKMDMLDVRIADMDRMGVDVQAVAVAVYQYYYWADPELGAKVARHDERGVRRGNGTVPRAFPAAGNRAAAGHRGRRSRNCVTSQAISACAVSRSALTSRARRSPARALTRSGPRSRRLGLVVIIHTQGATHAQRLQDHNFVNIIGHAFEATLAHRAPDLRRRRRAPSRPQDRRGARRRLPARLRRAASTTAGERARTSARASPSRPPTYLRKFFFDTMVFEPGQVEFLVDLYGADHVLLGTDYPVRHGRRGPARAARRDRRARPGRRSTSSPAATPPGCWG